MDENSVRPNSLSITEEPQYVITSSPIPPTRTRTHHSKSPPPVQRLPITSISPLDSSSSSSSAASGSAASGSAASGSAASGSAASGSAASSSAVSSSPLSSSSTSTSSSSSSSSSSPSIAIFAPSTTGDVSPLTTAPASPSDSSPTLSRTKTHKLARKKSRSTSTNESKDVPHLATFMPAKRGEVEKGAHPLSRLQNPSPIKESGNEAQAPVIFHTSSNAPSDDTDTSHRCLDVTYMRHGQSMGNAKYFWWAADGYLTKLGREQTFRRMEQILLEDVVTLMKTDIVLVSPSCRAVQTALIVMMQAHLMTGLPVPRIMVQPLLREKTKTISDKPGAAALYRTFMKTCTDITKLREFDEVPPEVKKSLIEQLVKTYETGQDHADAASFGEQIASFRHWLRNFAQLNEKCKSVFIVAHSGLARYMLMHLLPGPPQSAEDILSSGVRKVYGLNNCGMIKVQFEVQTSMFTLPYPGFLLDTPDDSGGLQFNDLESYPNFNKEMDPVPILDIEPLKLRGLVPENTRFWCGNVKKQRKRGDHTLRFVTISKQKQIYLSWGKKWGEPLKSMVLTPSSFDFTQAPKNEFETEVTFSFKEPVGDQVYIVSNAQAHAMERILHEAGAVAEHSRSGAPPFPPYAADNKCEKTSAIEPLPQSSAVSKLGDNPGSTPTWFFSPTSSASAFSSSFPSTSSSHESSVT